MKNKLLMSVVAAAMLMGATAHSALAQAAKIGYIDSIKIFAESTEAQEAERLYRREVDQWTAQKEAKERQIVQLQEELAAQSLMLSEEKKKEKQLELQRQMGEFEQFMAETFGNDGLAARRNKELTQPIVEKINRILETLAKDQGYAMIFDVANADVVYADKELDLSEVVLAELNKQN